ncbi:MAG: hypothetical protein GY795_07645 [Desulfobacterales bacterium]|nr:hypothetical protein [Desulfobacterales bacterium]
MDEFKILTDVPPYIDQSIEIYRKFWADVCPNQVCEIPTNFDGDVSDIDALSYCSYEVGFPGEDYILHASAIWANFLYTNLPLAWARHSSGEFALLSTEIEYYCIFPYRRVLDAMKGGYARDEEFEGLTRQVLIDLENIYGDEPFVSEFERLIEEFISDSGFFST